MNEKWSNTQNETHHTRLQNCFLCIFVHNLHHILLRCKFFATYVWKAKWFNMMRKALRAAFSWPFSRSLWPFRYSHNNVSISSHKSTCKIMRTPSDHKLNEHASIRKNCTILQYVAFCHDIIIEIWMKYIRLKAGGVN